MKKIIKWILLVMVIFLTTGCRLFRDNLDGAKIYTTVYPIQFLVEKLYGNHSTITSIYPTGADINSYVLTKKQIKDYAKGDLFIYTGLSSEKNIAKSLINQNHNLLIIDVSNGLNYNNSVEELWLSPNNFLMLAKNIKDNLNEYLTSKIIKNEVNEEYEELAEKLSLMDANLRNIANDAKKKNKETIIVNNDIFLFLEDYGFDVISLDIDTVSNSTLSHVKSLFKNKKQKNMIVLNDEIDNNLKNIIKTYDVKKINVSDLIYNTSKTDDYIEQMKKFIVNLQNITIGN